MAALGVLSFSRIKVCNLIIVRFPGKSHDFGFRCQSAVGIRPVANVNASSFFKKVSPFSVLT